MDWFDDGIQYLTPWQVATQHHAIVLDYANSHDDPILPNLNYKLQELVSAVETCRQQYYDTIYIKAAAIMRSLAQNHPFYDGNKRTAFIAMKSFLMANDFVLICSDDEALKTVTDLVVFPDKRDLNIVAKWIEDNSRSLDSLTDRPASMLPIIRFFAQLFSMWEGSLEYAKKLTGENQYLDIMDLVEQLMQNPDEVLPADMDEAERKQIIDSMLPYRDVDFREMVEKFKSIANETIEDAESLIQEMSNEQAKLDA